MRELGSRLERAREARGLTLEDAERDTRISRRYLQALETEQFEAIPAPVYARGFLRSYSQYLGLDPQEMLSLFPRDVDEPPPPATPRASAREPLSAVGPARPSWRSRPADPEPAPRERERAPRRESAPPPEPNREPVIGIDFGMPSPARRIQTDPAAQTRTTVVIVVAVAAILIVSIVAFAISRTGKGNDSLATPTTSGTGIAGTATPRVTADTSSAAIPGVERGTVPNLIGMPVASARTAIAAAGYQVSELPSAHAEPKNTVFDQTPAPGSKPAEGTIVTIAVSTGPQ